MIRAASLLVFLLTTAAAPAAGRPNFLFIIADDCTFRDLGPYGGQAHTPRLDRLAEQGMRFTRCFQAAPMCSPTRHNIYTGLYPVKSGAYPNHTFAKPGTKSVVHYLQPLGYRVALSGKTHIAPKQVFPFEFSGKANPDMAAVDKLMSECAATGEPFCLFACSNEPHTPWDKGDPSRYDAPSLKLPPAFVDTHETREAMTRYLAEVTYFDSQVGQLLDTLEAHGLAENTLVMVVSEQGSSLPFGKWTCYDTGLQSACIVRWPGVVPPGAVSDAMVEYVDVLPTFVEAAGGDPAPVLDGRSFLPVLRGERERHKEFVYGLMTTRGIQNGSDHYGIRSVRSDRYKYIRNLSPGETFQNACVTSPEFRSWVRAAEDGNADAADKVRRYQHRPAEELYDIVADPYEWTNLADHPHLAATKAELSRQLDAWMDAQGDRGVETELEAREHLARNIKGPGTAAAPKKPRRNAPQKGADR
ncbi:Choline-sulfatase [Pirellulimonas nuda]|uniref:Choline-sulfatase n=1 Tax=Pirellulimonas nuda TaxID=2528009 RepID=A0A518DI76_9BACT|nr:sulfatase [Pirellulimonas nuda]QDU91187.1 Choline-sulfatase [Pirellulimonas nuda]